MEEKEKVLIVGANIEDLHFEKSMQELESLVDACNMQVMGRVEQNLERINSALYIGTGKVNEVKALANELKVDVVVFNNELSPSQLKNLQNNLGYPILDRTSLILQIFSSRAKTKEAKLQVEVAKLKYMLPRLVGLHESLGRQGAGAGLSNKGSGEKKLELDRRRIEDKLTELNKKLEELSVTRETGRRQRKNSGLPLIALVGYTNAGKSTVMNAMVNKYKKDETKLVFEENMLFATLETTTREIELENKKRFLLSDTVGFISELPHSLVKAFRATLDEIKEADLLLHVIDYSDDNYEQHIDVTRQTLEEIGANEIPVIYVMNKSDLKLMDIPEVDDNIIYISAKKGIGIEELTNLIQQKVYSNYINCKMCIPYDMGSIISYLNENATITNTTYDEKGTVIDVNLSMIDYNRYIEYVIE